jgi:hypothetical protein
MHFTIKMEAARLFKMLVSYYTKVSGSRRHGLDLTKSIELSFLE